MKDLTLAWTTQDQSIAARIRQVTRFSRRVRTSEYHITNACNIRCEGCWFFTYDFDSRTRDAREVDGWREFARREHEERGITQAVLIGGEPSLFPKRIEAFAEVMPFITVSTNGLQKIPRQGLEDIMIGVTLFGGGPLDDRMRAIKPGGQRFTGLFDKALEHYRDDDRVHFNLALTVEALPYLDETVRRVRDNGNVMTFNYYSSHGSDDPLAHARATEQLLEEALRVQDLYPETVLSQPYYIRTLITGKTEWASFGYDVCPCVSRDNPQNRARLQNGAATLPHFNTWAADMKTVNVCCTSGHCDSCREAQAVVSWLLLSFPHFLESDERLKTWLEIAEAYWSLPPWSPFHRRHRNSRMTAFA